MKTDVGQTRIEEAARYIYALLLRGRQIGGPNTAIALDKTATNLLTIKSVCLAHPEVIATSLKGKMVLKLRRDLDVVTSEALRTDLEKHGITGMVAVEDELERAQLAEDASAPLHMPDIRSVFPPAEADAAPPSSPEAPAAAPADAKEPA